jgi:hypothetical protein
VLHYLYLPSISCFSFVLFFESVGRVYHNKLREYRTQEIKEKPFIVNIIFLESATCNTFSLRPVEKGKTCQTCVVSFRYPIQKSSIKILEHIAEAIFKVVTIIIILRIMENRVSNTSSVIYFELFDIFYLLKREYSIS